MTGRAKASGWVARSTLVSTAFAALLSSGCAGPWDSSGSGPALPAAAQAGSSNGPGSTRPGPVDSSGVRAAAAGEVGALAAGRGGPAPTAILQGARPALPCPAAALPAGWLAAENARTGPALQPAASSTVARVVGYPSRASARCGDSVGVQLSGHGETVRLAGYRMGWYHGAGSRLVWRSAPVRVPARPTPGPAASTHLVQPDWPASVTLTVDAGWPPGVYLFVPLGDHGPLGPGIPLVLRDDAGTEPILFKASTLTWNAYDDWGGWSLYRGPRGSAAHRLADRARVVALHRPLTGPGYEQMALMDLPVVRFAERVAAGSGLDLGYATDTDVDERPELLARHAELLVGGHSEYWTTSMYDGLLAARDAGVNLVFLGANQLWWRTRLEGSAAAAASGLPPDRQVVYRSVGGDPAARTDPAAATVLWDSRTLDRDPANVVAASHSAIEAHGGLQIVSAPDWFVAGTGLRVGSTLPGTVGNEADGFDPAARNPGDTEILAAGVLRGRAGPVTVTVGYATGWSGSAVFSAGTTDWACLLGGGCPDLRPGPAATRTVGRLTRNVLLALATPRGGSTHPPRANRIPAAAVLVHQLAPAAVGRYGVTDDD